MDDSPTEQNQSSPSLKKGRFSIENAKTENIAKTFSNYKKGRFTIHQSGMDSQNAALLEIIEKQSEQIEMLFDMVKNLSGNDKLFHKEFQECSKDVYESLQKLKRTFEAP